MSGKYHVSDDGIVRPCKAATPESCRANTDPAMKGKHFDSVADGDNAYAKVIGGETFKGRQKQSNGNDAKIEKMRNRIISEDKINGRPEKSEAEISKLIGRVLKNEEWQKQAPIRREKERSQELERREKEEKAVEKKKRKWQAVRNVKEADENFYSISSDAIERFNNSEITLDEVKSLSKQYNEAIKNGKQSLSDNVYEIGYNTPGRDASYRLADKIMAISAAKFNAAVDADNRAKRGITGGLFGRKERATLIIENGIDYVKNMYDPNLSEEAQSFTKKAHDNLLHPRGSNSRTIESQTIGKIIKNTRIAGRRAVILKMSDPEFPVKGQKDYIHFPDVDLSNNEEDKKELLKIEEKMSAIKSKMKKYELTLKETGEKADPEIVQSARMSLEIGKNKADDIMNRVKKENEMRGQVEEFFDNSSVDSRSRANEAGLDLFNESKVSF